MSFSWAGAAAGGYEARRQQRQDEMAAAEFELRRRALEAQLAGQKDARLARQEDRQRQADQQRIDNARIVTGLLTPGEVSSDQAAMLRGTPYGTALLEDKQTLPSRTGLGESQRVDPGGQAYTTFLGTPEQREVAAQRAAREQALRDPNLPPMVGRLVRLRDVGINLPNPESLISPAERDAQAARERELDFQDFERRERLQASLRPSPAQAASRGVTPQNRLQARRWAQQDAADAYEAMKDVNGFVPDGVSLEQLAADLEAEYLSELDPSYKRPPRPVNPTQALENLQQVFPGGRAVGSRQTPMVGTLVLPDTSRRTISRAELQATAQRLGITEQQAEAEARKRGFEVRR